MEGSVLLGTKTLVKNQFGYHIRELSGIFFVSNTNGHIEKRRHDHRLLQLC